MWCFLMLGESEKLLPKTTLIKKDNESFDLDIKCYFVQCYLITYR